MTKVTLDRETFKALASDTRLDILKSLDGRHMSLKDICTSTKMNKATLHEHLVKLHEAGLIKKNEREGHKWVYYKLTWKGECLLHPENTRIVVLFTTTFITLWIGIIQLAQYVKGTAMNLGYNIFTVGPEAVIAKGENIYLDRGLYNTSSLSLPSDSPYFLKAFITRTESWTYGNHSLSIPLGKNLSFIGTSNDGIGALPEDTHLVVDKSEGVLQAVSQDPTLLYIAIACFIVFTAVLCISLWRLWENKTQKI
jgi:DNA-binding transcriptional ArsR family regulator